MQTKPSTKGRTIKVTDVAPQKFTIKTKLTPNDKLEYLQHKCTYEINSFKIQKTLQIITEEIQKGQYMQLLYDANIII